MQIIAESHLYLHKKNMKSIKILALFIAVAAFMSSCSKSQKEILTSTTWNPSKFVALGTDYASASCVKDNEWTFTTGGKVINVPMGVACSAGEKSDTTISSLSEDAKTLTYLYNKPPTPPILLTLTVTELTATNLKASTMSPVPVTVELTAKK